MSTLRHRLPKLALITALVTMLVLVPLSTVFADNPPPANGQPNQSCEVTTVTPGNAVNAPGSAFNPNGMAGTVYAGTQPQNSKNPMSVSQYDVACFQQTSHGH
jgi:hypothetical protein